MPGLCNARVTWYREPGHIAVEDVCVLENVHLDYDHLPAGKVQEQGETRIWNEAITAAAAATVEALAGTEDLAAVERVGEALLALKR